MQNFASQVQQLREWEEIVGLFSSASTLYMADVDDLVFQLWHLVPVKFTLGTVEIKSTDSVIHHIVPHIVPAGIILVKCG